MPPTPHSADETVYVWAERLQALAALPSTAHVTTEDAAAYLGTTPAVLRVWRSQGKGPRFKGRGYFVRYEKCDLDEFMDGFSPPSVNAGG